MGFRDTTSSQEKEPDDAQNGIVKFLQRPLSYPDRTANVERIETHISWIFLTDRFAYKLKKPVRFDFLDFSTPAKRRWACEQEVALNRRLASDVYLEVVPITSDEQGRLQLGGLGAPAEWVVKMRRLPADRALDQLIRAEIVSQTQVNELATRLTEFYEQLPPVGINVAEYRQALEEHVFGNQRVLSSSSLNSDALKRVHSAQVRLLRVAPELLDERVCDGRIVDGHGDLRPEHIYFDPHPTIIDCIEFNRDLRQVDVLDELAFLASECEHLQAAWVGDQVIERYRATSGDPFPQVLLDFYKTYRSCVRMKVLTLRASQLPRGDKDDALAEAERYLQLADRRAARFCPPLLLIVYGLSGTGKTTVAQRLADQLQIDSLETDVIRRELFGSNVSVADYGQAHYLPSLRRRVYEEMFDRAEQLLGEQLSVILDGTFYAADLRQQAADLARRHAAVPLLIHCHCRSDLALERIASRAAIGESRSDATAETYQRQRAAHEPDPPGLPICDVDTDAGLAEMTEIVFRKLRKLLGLDSQDTAEHGS